MPELPEVETIVRGLNRAITGKSLRRFSVFDTKRLARPRLTLPQKISSVRRHGKYIVCETSGGLRCLIHLRMTGELLFVAKKATIVAFLATNKKNQKTLRRMDPQDKHERAAFHFADGSLLRFVDVRRFGTINWFKKSDALPNLGPDPLGGDFGPKTLLAAARKSSRAVKSLLLDQKIIAGIGNIYADEALWTAKIHPQRKSNSLTAPEAAKLAAAVKYVLREGIKKGGFTLRDYRHVDGSSGYYQESRKVYDREGLPCFRCRAKIRRIKLGGRSSYFCPKCQK